MKHADLALYRAKGEGGGRIRFFEPEMQAEVEERAILEGDLRQGLQEGQFLLHYQSQVDSDFHITGAEALLRWQHPTRGLLLPSDFINVAEECGLIESIGRWAIQEVCRQLVKWSDQPTKANLTLAVNISAREFRHPEFVPLLLKIVRETGVNPRKLTLELTERATFGPLEEIRPKMDILKAHGFCFALDDFGVGFSSLSCLKDLPLDKLKIDKSFIGDLQAQNNSSAIVEAILALGQSLGLEVIAEGVETEKQLQILASKRCVAYQGYLFGRPSIEDDLWTVKPPIREN
jgi:EAL domain-containing protein (putative c-di-GMP-specific phosphodiesterase class I)